MMNTLQRCKDPVFLRRKPDDISIPNVLRQALSLIAKMPLIAVYGYHAYRHYHENQNLIIRNRSCRWLKTFCRCLHPDGEYTALEAKVRCCVNFTQTTAEITQHLRHTLSPPPEPIPTLLLRLLFLKGPPRRCQLEGYGDV